LVVPKQAERTLANGLTVIVIRRPGVPLVELRLRVPFAKANLARGDVLSQSIFSGTEKMSVVDSALGASTDSDRLLISGNALAPGLPRLLEILADVLGNAFFFNDTATTE